MLSCHEQHAHHWVGHYEDLVAVFAYRGSEEDVRHIEVSSDLVSRRFRATGRRIKVLFAIEPHEKRPSAEVRTVLRAKQRELSEAVARLAVVIPGRGFGPSLQRGAVNGFLAVATLGLRNVVFEELRGALGYLVGADAQHFDALLGDCSAHYRW